MFNKITAAAISAVGFLAIGAASAAPVSFTSNGSFANISGCGGASIFAPCSISPSGNTLDMSGNNNSTLTAIDFGPTAFNTDANNVTIGEINWVNRASGGFLATDPNFNVNYILALTFTQPNADTAGQTFNINVQQTSNPLGDVTSGFVISGLPATFNLGGVDVTGFNFVETGPGTFAGGVWTNPEGGNSTLRLTANFTAVPEPASLSLFGAGLLGLAALRRRQARKAA